MKFDYEPLVLNTDALSLEYYYVPWDSELMECRVSRLQQIEVRDCDRAYTDFNEYEDWKRAQGIEFSSASVKHRHCNESQMIESHGYRFIELNYRPEFDLGFHRCSADQDLEFKDAHISDKPALCEMASSIFRDTRFHRDPRLGKAAGDKRYGYWMRNAFDLPHQQVIKCLREGEIVAFFVQETPQPGQVFWSLVGLAPGLQGQGLGTRVWKSALSWLKQRGAVTVRTSISSLNLPVFNLYVRLGFHFPEPDMIFHWHRPAEDS